jgi:hypothetical protein
MGYEQIIFHCSFDRAVSLLSMSGYYLEGFIRDDKSKSESYSVYARNASINNRIGIISRNQSFEFLEDNKESKSRRKQIREALLEGIIKTDKKRNENSGFAKDSAKKDKNNKPTKKKKSKK